MEEINIEDVDWFIKINNIFTNGITKNWLYSLAHGKCYFFKDYGIVSVSKQYGFIVINSASTTSKFTVDMIRFIKNILIDNDKVILSHDGNGIRGIEKIGFRYDNSNKYYIKGEL